MRTKQYLVGLFAVLAVSLGGWALANNNATSTPSATATPTATVAATPLQSAVYKGEAGKTALASLKATYTVETKEYTGIGEYVTGINGHTADDSHYWGFYVDGKMADVGAGDYTAKGGEDLEFRYTAQ